MATPNYSYEKRQRELAKKRKKEEKLRQKAAGNRQPDAPGEQDAQPAPAEGGMGVQPDADPASGA